MPQDGTNDTTRNGPSNRHATASTDNRSWRDVFGIPEPVKKAFRKFPLTTYASNDLPITSPGQRSEHSLWLWTRNDGASENELSFNPTCLKWQTYLKFCGIAFRTVASNNHASPTGILPFVLPASSSAFDQSAPIPSSKIRTWAKEHGSNLKDEVIPLRADAYSALVDHRIRRAWLYILYLEPANFESVAKRLYVAPSSSNPLVTAAIAYQLRKAAQEELLKTNTHVSAEELIEEAKDAFSALSTLLKEDDWFFDEKTPGLFDASVFAYTHLLLDEQLGWQRNDLSRVLGDHPNLVAHRNRILDQYFS